MAVADLARAALGADLPDGPAWQPKAGGNLDLLLSGVADALSDVDVVAEATAHVRDPMSTAYLDELEHEFGISPSPGLTDAQRRANLQQRKTARNLKGQYWVLQNAITAAGFTGVNVYPNDPAVDPSPFLTGTAQMVAGGSNAYAGRSDAYAALYGGVLIVNGSQYQNSPAVVGCGSGLVFCHPLYTSAYNSNLCGAYTYSQRVSILYGPPKEPVRWPLVFFIAGTATFNGDGSVATLTQCSVPTARLGELISLILRYKPLHTWAALIYSAT